MIMRPSPRSPMTASNSDNRGWRKNTAAPGAQARTPAIRVCQDTGWAWSRNGVMCWTSVGFLSARLKSSLLDDRGPHLDVGFQPCLKLLWRAGFRLATEFKHPLAEIRA